LSSFLNFCISWILELFQKPWKEILTYFFGFLLLLCAFCIFVGGIVYLIGSVYRFLVFKDYREKIKEKIKEGIFTTLVIIIYCLYIYCIIYFPIIERLTNNEVLSCIYSIFALVLPIIVIFVILFFVILFREKGFGYLSCVVKFFLKTKKWTTEQIVAFFSLDNLFRYFLVIVFIAGGVGFLKLDNYYNNTYKNLKPKLPCWEFNPEFKKGTTPPFICKANTAYRFYSRYGFDAVYIEKGISRRRWKDLKSLDFWVCFPEETKVQCICGTYSDMFIPKGKLIITQGKKARKFLY